MMSRSVSVRAKSGKKFSFGVTAACVTSAWSPPTWSSANTIDTTAPTITSAKRKRSVYTIPRRPPNAA